MTCAVPPCFGTEENRPRTPELWSARMACAIVTPVTWDVFRVRIRYEAGSPSIQSTRAPGAKRANRSAVSPMFAPTSITQGFLNIQRKHRSARDAQSLAIQPESLANDAQESHSRKNLPVFQPHPPVARFTGADGAVTSLWATTSAIEGRAYQERFHTHSQSPSAAVLLEPVAGGLSLPRCPDLSRHSRCH